MKRVLVAILVGLIVPLQLAVSTPALAAPSVTVAPNPVAPGQTLTITGTGFLAITNYTIYTVPQIFTPQGVVTNSSGTFTSSVPVPLTAPAEQYTLYVASGSQPLASTSFSVGTTQIILNPTTVAPGNTVTVTGSNLPSNTTLYAYATVALTTGGNQTIQNSQLTGAQGNFSTTLTIPANTTPGQYTVYIGTEVNSSTPISSAPLTVGITTTITLTPTSQAEGPNAAVTVNGAGFGDNEQVLISYSYTNTSQQSATENVTATTSATGTFTASLPVPANAVPNTYTVKAVGFTSGLTASAQLTITAPLVLTLSPTTTTPGGVVTVSGQHFLPNTAVTITAPVTLAGGTSTTLTANTTTDSAGSFSTTLTIPASAAAGSITVNAAQTQNGTTVNTTTAALTVSSLNATIHVSPSPVTPGSAVTVTGSGFVPGPNQNVTVGVALIVNGAQQSVTQTVDTTTSGTFSTTLTIPAGTTPATYTVSALQSTSGASANTSLIVQSITPTPTSTLVVPPPPGATSTPTPTPTSTPIATPTNTPIPTPTPRPPAPAGTPHFKSLSLWYHIVRVGTFNHVDVQGTPRRRLGIWVHVLFPSGIHYDYYTQTDTHGHWSKTFPVPFGTISQYSRRAYIQLQLWLHKKTVKDYIPFTLIH